MSHRNDSKTRFQLQQWVLQTCSCILEKPTLRKEKAAHHFKKCVHLMLEGFCSSFEQMPIFKWLQKLRCCSLNRALCVKLPHLLHYNRYHTRRAKWAALWVGPSSLQTSLNLSIGILEQKFPTRHSCVCTCSICHTCHSHTARTAFTNEPSEVKQAQEGTNNVL